MTKKRGILFGIFLAIGIIFMISFVSAVYCCEKTIEDIDPDTVGNQGGMCEEVDEINLCNPGYGKAPTSCDQTTYCERGTCINIASGTCDPTREAICKATAGNSWLNENIDDIEVCQQGCCIIGDRVRFITETQCNQVALKEGLNVKFRGDLDAGECFALDLTKEKAACTREENFATTCTIETEEDCINVADSTFHKGLLCTAAGISNCQKSKTTRCENDKVYFTDTCNNLANVYDKDKYDIDDYWTYIQEPECSVTGADSSCGNCDYRLGTICSEYKRGLEFAHAMPDSAPEYGINVCRDLSCNYEGTIYAHGESWCYELPGTYPHIPAVINETVRTGTDIELGIYNVPGSKYYRLQCWDGEVIPYACEESFRNQICYESSIDIADDEDTNGDGVYLIGTCRVNNWRGCSLINNSAECENPIRDCKWLHGYRFDLELFDEFLGDPSEIPAGEDEQGSCVPLFAPGYKFWKEDSDGVAFCASGTIAESAFYETYWMRSRDRFEDVPAIDASHRCLENCYSIPGYGSGITLQQVMDFYNGIDALPGNNDQYYLSLRKGHYCAPINFPLIEDGERALGSIGVGLPPQCAQNEKRVIEPLFYTNEQYLNFLKNRTAALGDCGFKENAAGEHGQSGGEIITAVFEKLNQKGEVKENGTVETIYSGDSYTLEGYRTGRGYA